MEGLYSLLYLTLILTILFSLHTQIAHKLLIGKHPLHLKKSPHLPLRFNSDGTFKILQVLFFSSDSRSFFLLVLVLALVFFFLLLAYVALWLTCESKQVADMHYGTGVLTSCKDVLASEFHYCSDLNTTHFLKRIIEAEKPDFIAFTGIHNSLLILSLSLYK